MTQARKEEEVHPVGMRSRRGQALVEYLLLLCSVMLVALTIGALLQRRAPELADRLFTSILNAAITVATR